MLVSNAYESGKNSRRSSTNLTKFLQYLRSSSKGYGQIVLGHINLFSEILLCPEQHQNCEVNGVHWHLLIKGAAFISHEVLKKA